MGYTTEGKGNLVVDHNRYIVFNHRGEDFIEDVLRNVAANSSERDLTNGTGVEVYLVITTDPETVSHKGRHHGIIPFRWVPNRGLFVKCPKCHKMSRPEEFYPKPDWVKRIEKRHSLKTKSAWIDGDELWE